MESAIGAHTWCVKRKHWETSKINIKRKGIEYVVV